MRISFDEWGKSVTSLGYINEDFKLGDQIKCFVCKWNPQDYSKEHLHPIDRVFNLLNHAEKLSKIEGDEHKLFFDNEVSIMCFIEKTED